MGEGSRSLLRGATERAREAAKALELSRQSGLWNAMHLGAAIRFLGMATRSNMGPHLATMFHACNSPEKLAVACASCERTYAALDEDVNSLAHALIELGVTPGDRVAALLPNCVEHLVSQIAVPRIGATVVELGTRLKAEEIGYLLADADPQVLIYHGRYAEVVKGARRIAGTPELEQLIAVGVDGPGRRYKRLLRDYRGDRPPRTRGKGAFGGMMVYTSGTTGKPKGADRRLDEISLYPALDFMTQVGMRHDDRQLIVCPLYHSAAPAFAGMMLVLGATSIILDSFDEVEILRTIERERITGAFMVPTMLARMANLPSDVRAQFDTSSLRWVCSGAAPLATDTAASFQEAFGQLLWNFYGATETGLVTLAGPYDHASRPQTVGRALAGNEIWIVGEDGERSRTGTVGEVYVRNGMLIRGYHNDPEGSEASLLRGAFSVGDLGRLDEQGFLYLESRKHDMVISGGVNIYPREIENHLMSHPKIKDVAVVGVPDPDWGEALRAYVVRRPGSSLAATDVEAYCRRSLADFKRPRSVVFVDALPRNPTGKILKRELRALE